MLLKASVTSAALLAATAVVSVSATPVTVRSAAAPSSGSYVLFNATQIGTFNKLVLQQIKNGIFSNTPNVDYDSSKQTQTTSAANIVKYSRYAGASYGIFGLDWNCKSNCEAADTRGTLVDYHWDNIVFPSTGYVAHNDNAKEIIVSFRGSTVLFDWLANAMFETISWPQSVPGSRVHHGFHDAYYSAAKEIKENVARLLAQHPDYSIVVTGHSLGGAQAAICAADIAATHPEWLSKLKLYTYGQPRTGNAKFANWLSSQPFPIYRVTFKGDIVPQVPLRAMDYQHHGQEVYYPFFGSMRFCGANPENKNCQDGVWPIALNPFDHLLYPGLDYDLASWLKANIKWLLRL
ncbi:hypothetical protein GGI12_004046 [Dipsacomyces acuminosporus]|nr:hypothetical protein GGI12_004046 [Dipsacomyces acuminosporus]